MSVPLPIVFTAWGPTPGHGYEGSIGGLCDLAKAAGVKTVALQVGQAEPRHADQVRSKGMKVAAWGNIDQAAKAAVDAMKPDVIVAQIEGPGQYDAAIRLFDSNPYPGADRAVVTTYGGLASAAAWNELTRRGVQSCLVECYASDDPVIHANLDTMLWQGTQYGIPAEMLFAVVGTYRGETPSAYRGLTTARLRTLGLYLAEQMSAAQWEAWGAQIRAAQQTTPPPPTLQAFWDVRSGAAILHSERAVTYSATDDGLGRTLAWLASNKATVRAAKSVEIRWTRR